MKKYILASGSPRRRDLLRSLGIEFEIIKPTDETSILNKPFSYELIEQVALEKGLSVANKLQNSVVISADTVVIYDNVILGKPKDFDDALRMLKLLNGKTHKVVTSICVIDTETKEQKIHSETSEVTFNNIPEQELKDYIYQFKPYDKAGSYGIQELKESFINNITGEFDNIVGLPTKALKNILIDLNLV